MKTSGASYSIGVWVLLTTKMVLKKLKENTPLLLGKKITFRNSELLSLISYTPFPFSSSTTILWMLIGLLSLGDLSNFMLMLLFVRLTSMQSKPASCWTGKLSDELLRVMRRKLVFSSLGIPSFISMTPLSFPLSRKLYLTIKSPKYCAFLPLW